MSTGPRIEIIVDENGNKTVEAFGLKGSGCKKLTEDFERVGVKVADKIKSADFYATQNQQIKQ